MAGQWLYGHDCEHPCIHAHLSSCTTTCRTYAAVYHAACHVACRQCGSEDGDVDMPRTDCLHRHEQPMHRRLESSTPSPQAPQPGCRT